MLWQTHIRVLSPPADDNVSLLVATRPQMNRQCVGYDRLVYVVRSLFDAVMASVGSDMDAVG